MDAPEPQMIIHEILSFFVPKYIEECFAFLNGKCSKDKKAISLVILSSEMANLYSEKNFLNPYLGIREALSLPALGSNSLGGSMVAPTSHEMKVDLAGSITNKEDSLYSSGVSYPDTPESIMNRIGAHRKFLNQTKQNNPIIIDKKAS